MGTVKLEVGEVTATVEVSSALPLIENSQAQVTNEFTSENIDKFAGIQGNEGLDFLALTLPGVASNRDLGFSNTNGPGFAVNGLRGRNNDQQIDGQNNNDNSWLVRRCSCPTRNLFRSIRSLRATSARNTAATLVRS